MTKKNRSPKYSTNPFSSLRGFSASSATPPAPSPSPANKPVPEEAPEPEDLFAQEMSRLGVKTPAAQRSSAPKPEVAEQTPIDDLALFLDAVGEMTTVLAEADAGEETGAATASSLVREAQRGRVTPEDTLDLHGYSRVEALAKVGWFVDNALHHGCRYLLVITGRGRQSGEAVLREVVEGWLRSPQNRGVREWCRAPAHLGGEGALLLALKRKG
jgi:DNA-nicking Smr family endonuclease